MHNRPLWALVSVAALAAAGCSQQGAAGNGAAAAGAPAPAPSSGFAFASDPCQVVMTATRAVLQHDHATQMTLPVMASGTSRQAQSVQVGGKTYIQVDNVWTVSRMSVADELQTVNDEAKTAQTTCKAAGADVINGQPVSIYDAHVVNQGSTSDNRLWISVASGLPLKIETHLDTGGVSTQLIRYDNVTTPANVQTSPG
jgi:hypothetical protein